MLVVREHIEEFTRGENPLKSLNIGKRAQIDNWFRTWDPNVDYEIDDNLNIKVKRFLNFSYSNITFLPDNLYIDGWLGLDIRDTNITSLPNNLNIKGDLYISKTKITSLPDDLQVGGVVYKDF